MWGSGSRDDRGALASKGGCSLKSWLEVVCRATDQADQWSQPGWEGGMSEYGRQCPVVAEWWEVSPCAMIVSKACCTHQSDCLLSLVEQPVCTLHTCICAGVVGVIA